MGLLAMSDASSSSFSSSSCELIPGLPTDMAFMCLAKVPRIYHGTLKAVCTKWQQTIGSKEFYTLRKKLDLTDETVFMVKNDMLSGKLHCMEVDLKTKKCSKALYVNDAVTNMLWNYGFGSASLGHLVLFFGGRRSSGTLHIFNTLSRTWRNGASMHYPRAAFCYGVIDDKLYVAGGYTVRRFDLVTTGEVYDAETDRWSVIAEIPIALHIDIFCVFRKRLVLRGVTNRNETPRVLSYSPESDRWQEENWLANLLSRFEPFSSAAIGATTKNDDTIYVTATERSYRGTVQEDRVNVVKVEKLDNMTLEWNSVTNYREKTDKNSCWYMIYAMGFNLFGLKDRVLILSHWNEVVHWNEDNEEDKEDDEGDKDDMDDSDDHEEEAERYKFKLVYSDEVVTLRMECPVLWATTVVDA